MLSYVNSVFFRHLEEANQTLEAMLRPKVTTLPGHIQAVYVQNMVKLYASILQQKEQAGEKEAAQEITQLMIERLPQFVQSADLEVQERVREQSEAIQGAQLEEVGWCLLNSLTAVTFSWLSLECGWDFLVLCFNISSETTFAFVLRLLVSCN